MAGSKDNNNISLKLKCEYDIRFRGLERYRNAVWGIVCKNIFSKYIKENANVLDLGAGYGEFINNIKADQKIAMDINDDCRSRLEPNVHFIHQDCSETWQLDNQKLDIVFSSNLMEHLKSKEKVESLLSEAYRCLKNGGKIILIGPNIKYTGGAYWDFWDHLLPLTEKSLSEILIMKNFKISRCIARVLPYSMSNGFNPPLFFVRMYIKIPFLWRFAGKQFLIIAEKTG